MKTNKNWYPSEETGSYHKIIDGVLYYLPMLQDGSKEKEEYKAEVDWNFAAVEPYDGERTLYNVLKEIEKSLEAKD